MKTPTFPRVFASVTMALTALATASAFGPYDNPYDGTATVQAGKKTGVLDATGTVTTTDGTDAAVVVSGTGSKGIRVNAVLMLKSDGTGTLSLDARCSPVLQNLSASMKFPTEKKSW
jgi:hypothetical protein